MLGHWLGNANFDDFHFPRFQVHQDYLFTLPKPGHADNQSFLSRRSLNCPGAKLVLTAGKVKVRALLDEQRIIVLEWIAPECVWCCRGDAAPPQHHLHDLHDLDLLDVLEEIGDVLPARAQDTIALDVTLPGIRHRVKAVQRVQACGGGLGVRARVREESRMQRLLGQRDVGGIRSTREQCDGEGRQDLGKERVETVRGRGIVRRGVVAVVFRGSLPGGEFVAREDGRGAVQRVARDDEAGDTGGAGLVGRARCFARQVFDEQIQGQVLGAVRGHVQARHDGQLARAPSRGRGLLAARQHSVLALPALRLAGQVGVLSGNDVKGAVRLLGAQRCEHAARDIVGAKRLAQDAQAARLVLEHHVRGLGGGEIRGAFGRGGDPVLLGDVVQHVGLQAQVHEDGADDPAELALAHVEDALDELGPRAAQLAAVSAASPECALRAGAYLEVVPGVVCLGLDVVLEVGQAQEVHVGELLRVVAVGALGQVERVQRAVVGRAARRRCGCVLAVRAGQHVAVGGRHGCGWGAAREAARAVGDASSDVECRACHSSNGGARRLVSAGPADAAPPKQACTLDLPSRGQDDKMRSSCTPRLAAIV
jgi:hypothetical protein